MQNCYIYSFQSRIPKSSFQLISKFLTMSSTSKQQNEIPKTKPRYFKQFIKKKSNSSHDINQESMTTLSDNISLGGNPLSMRKIEQKDQKTNDIDDNKTKKKLDVIQSQLKISSDDHMNSIAEDNIVSLKEITVSESHISQTLFQSLKVAPSIKRALSEVLKYTNMTVVQEKSIDTILNGLDVFVKARTGTGKTLGFLIPAIDILLRNQASTKPGSPGYIKPILMIISPTRELVLQIAAETQELCTYNQLKIVTFVGGTNVNTDVRYINQGFDIIIATPGRLAMHLKETPGFSQACKGVKYLVLDEADRLLDMGFKPDIDRIASYLHASTLENPRQTLLFSATFSSEVKGVADKFLRKNYRVIDTVGEDVEQTHSHVSQSLISAPIEDQSKVLYQVIREHIQQHPKNYKIMVFFATAMATQYESKLFSLLGTPVLEIHSRKSQGYRTRTSEEFREAKSAIIFSSDVTARGMDYPDVTLVIQVGYTSRDQYIHRLGRTARAGKEGAGILIVAPFEERAMRSELNDMPLINLVLSSAPEAVNLKMQNIRNLYPQLRDEAKSAWQAWLGFYKSLLKKFHWNSIQLVETSREVARGMGLSQLPSIPKQTLGKM